MRSLVFSDSCSQKNLFVMKMMLRFYFCLLVVFIISFCVPGVVDANFRHRGGHYTGKHKLEKWMCQGFGGRKDCIALDVAKDENPDPAVYATTIVAEEADVEIDGIMVKALTYNGTVPGPLIRVKEGDHVVVHFINNLDISSTIHWHGIAFNNEADGTLITQMAVPPGGTFTYSFTALNPGNHWYHSHDKTAYTLFHGMYGAIIVESLEEEQLREDKVLPKDEGTIILSDITFDEHGNIRNLEGATELEKMNGVEGEKLLVNGMVKPTIHAKANEPFTLRLINTSISRYWRLKLSDGSSLVRIGGEGGLLNQAVLQTGATRGVEMDMPMQMCTTDDDCKFNRMSRYAVCVPMDNMKVCGKMNSPVDLGFEEGELVLAPGMRATVVILPGEQDLALIWSDFNRGIHSMEMQMSKQMCMNIGMGSSECTDPQYPDCVEMMMNGMMMKTCGKMCSSHESCTDAKYPMCMLMSKENDMAFCGTMLHDQYKVRDEVDVLTIQVGRAPLFLRGNKPVGAFDAGTSLRETSNLLHDLGTLAPNVVWKGENRINLQGGMNETGTWFKIDGVQGKFDTGTLSEKKLPAPPGSAREAEAGDAIEFEIHNDTEMNHPFHLHGFIFQPLYFLKMHHMGMMDGHRELHGEAQPYMIRYNYGPTEFVDTIDIPPHTSLVARVVLEDYPGSRGRWLFHCHIAQHAELGMISEIHVTA